MAVFAVVYQLNKDKDYPKLWEELARLGGHKAQNSLYLLDLKDESEHVVGSHLRKYIDDVDDMLFVTKIMSRPYSLRCKKGTNDWLDARF